MKKIIRLTESDIHRIVKESVERVLKEGATSILYHYINLDNLVSCLETNSLRTCEPETTLDMDNEKMRYINGEGVRFISLTRNGNPSEGYPIVKYGEVGDGEFSCICRLTIDGDALNTYCNFKDGNGKRQNMKVKPIDWSYATNMGADYGNYSDGKNWMMHSDDSTYIGNSEYNDMLSSEDNIYKYGNIEYSDLYHHPYSQAEDRILTRAEYIPNANKYIKKIDIFVSSNSQDDDVLDDVKEQMVYINGIKKLSKKLNIPCEIHTQMKNFMYRR